MIGMDPIGERALALRSSCLSAIHTLYSRTMVLTATVADAVKKTLRLILDHSDSPSESLV
jgi:hypothetical protein